MQFNYDDGFGPGGEGNRFLLNIQPVAPITLNDEWNVISRTIVPVISPDDVIPGTGSQSGLGDITQSFFFAPKATTASGWTWGDGPFIEGSDNYPGTGGRRNAGASRIELTGLVPGGG